MSFKKGDKVWASVRVMGMTGTPRTEWHKGKVLFAGERDGESACLVDIRGIGVRERIGSELVPR